MHQLLKIAQYTDTSRDQNVNEHNGVDFFFVSRRKMEQDIQNNLFVEHAFHNGHYYGISVNSIRNIINEGKTCLLIVAPECIRSARTSGMKPFLIYLKPPTADHMKQNWVQSKWIKVRLTIQCPAYAQRVHLSI